MSTWYTNYSTFGTGAVHSTEVVTDAPIGTLCWVDLQIQFDYAMQEFAGSGVYPNIYDMGVALSWVAHGAGRPTFNTGGDDDSWFVWGGLDSSGGAQGLWLTSSSNWPILERGWLKYQWRGARKIGQAHDWWLQTNLNEDGAPQTANQSAWFFRAGYW
jgi:hypothetical protein